MQGQRGTIGSLREALEFECGSTSSSSTVDPQICWNNMQDSAENQIAEYILSPADMNSSYVNHERPNMSGWSLGEPSSSNMQSEINHNQHKREFGWSSSASASVVTGQRLEERQLEQNNVLSSDNVNTSPIYTGNSNLHIVAQNLNLNAGLVENGGDNSQHAEHPNMRKSSGLANECMPPTIVSGPFLHPSGSSSFSVEDNEGRPGCSMDPRRLSCKRKAVEANVGQSSDGGSSSYSQHTESGSWPTLPVHGNSRSSLNRSASPEQVSARLGLGMRDEASDSLPNLNVAGMSENFHRNFRLRLNPSSQQGSIPPPPFPTGSGSGIRHSNVSSSHMSQRFQHVHNSLELRPTPMVDNMISQSQPLVIQGPSLPRHPVRWTGGSSSRNSNSSSSILCADRDNPSCEEASSRSMTRNISEQPLFVPPTDLRSLVTNPTIRASGAANQSISGNVASSSRAGTNSAINPSSAPTWVSRPSPAQHLRRLPEYVRRSFFPPRLEPAAGQSNNFSPLHSGPPTSSDARMVSSAAASQAYHQLHSRSSSWRQVDGELGIPYSLRSLAVSGEGSSRLVSELRNVLGLMRRGGPGGNLRFEDVMILDQSVFAGMADIHDRHRDMRLDVDNMSYEELLALEERIGNVSTGLSEEKILKLLKQKKYSGCQLEAEPCCVCQEEYNEGDDIGTLDCGHDYHAECIKKWLMHKNLCPICKTTGLAP